MPENRSSMGRAALLVLLAVLFMLASGPARAQYIQLEAENYTQAGGGGGSYGGDPLSVVACSAANGGLAVEGFDSEGDWIKLKFHLGAQTCFTDSLRSAGPLDEPAHAIGLQFFDASDALVASDTLRTRVGKGTG
jgi:hypothetical protein